MKRINILSVSVSITNLKDATSYLKKNLLFAKGTYITACNVHTTIMAKENEEYREIQNHSFMTLPDGKPLSMIGKRRGYSEMNQVSGPEFMEEVLKSEEFEDCSHYFYGNTESNLKSLINFLKKTYPKLKIVGIEPSVFRPLTTEEEEGLVQRINLSGASFVWVGMGAPIQEQMCEKLSNRTDSIWIGVGGAFNVIAGIIPRAPKWMQKCCLEWLYRLIKEPRRLWKRYFVTNSKFIFFILLDSCKKK